MDIYETLTLNITDNNSLHAAYMPFIKNGALFVVSDNNYKLGQLVVIVLRLFDELEVYTIQGKVVWITPRNAQGAYAVGIGVQFFANEENKIVRYKIENYLAKFEPDTPNTSTM